MQLREIHIDGFGIFSGKSVTGLHPGLNVLYGSNEQGKTTLLEFIRRVLFGFKIPRDHNPYPALNGGTYGGRLVIETSQGEAAVIARTSGTHGGPVTVTLGPEITEGQEAVDRLLSSASAELVRNVYAFTLTELHESESLKTGEVKNRIYGAGMGLGAVSLSDVTKSLDRRAGELYKSKGSTQVISGLYKEAQELQDRIAALKDNLPRYDACLAERGRLLDERQTLHQRLDEEEKVLRDLDLRQELFETWVELNRAEAELAALPLHAEISDSTYESFQKLKTELQGLDTQLQEETERLAQLQREAALIELPEAFLEKSEEVERLRQSIGQVRSAVCDKATLELERDKLDDQIQADLKCIGPNWTESRAAEFLLTESDRARLQTFADTFSELRQKVEAARSKLEYHREQQAQALSSKTKIPEWLRMFVFALGGVGLLALVAGAVMVDVILIVTGLLVLGIGGALHFKTRKQEPEFATEDVTGAYLSEAHEAAKREQDACFADWQDWLSDHGLADLTSPDPQGVEKTWTRVREIQADLRTREELDRRLARIQDTIREAEGQVHNASEHHPSLSPGTDVTANMESVCQAFDQARTLQDKQRHLQQEIAAQESKGARLAEKLSVHRESMQALVRSVDAADETDFQDRYRQWQVRRKWMERAREAQQVIQTRVGVGAVYKDFTESLQGVRPDELAARRQDLEHTIAQTRSRMQELDHETGRLQGEADRLVGDDSLVDLQNQLESVRHRMNRAAREWAALTLAGEILDRAKRQYETTRQPAVIQAASARFAQITAGRYTRIVKLLDSDELRVLDAEGRQKGVDELSRGTREQLYLAMRLGLIEEYETRAEPLPVVMDDVFVNFDDERKPRVLELLQDFSKDRQLLLLTCHRHSLDLCLEHGARLIEF